MNRHDAIQVCEEKLWNMLSVPQSEEQIIIY